jgi:phospholipid-binding lipoprotein MlaA
MKRLLCLYQPYICLALLLTAICFGFMIPGSQAIAASDNTVIVAQGTDTVSPNDSMEVNAPPLAANDVAAVESADVERDDLEEDLDAEPPVNNNGNGPQIADPIEPFNRAMYHFNDKLYFWVLKPVAQGYSTVVPEVIRVHVKNFFTNLAFPIRFVSSVLQADPTGAAQEAGRFFINTIWGVAGFFDLASEPEVNLPKQNSDLGQTFGIWGIGQGVYIVWPIFGPSSPRDTVGMVGDFFLYPVSYLEPWYASTGTQAYERINDTSLRIGDYEALVDAAIDPYIAIRDAYVQYRYKKIEQKRLKLQKEYNLKSETSP